MIAGIINICGAFGGNMAGPNPHNAKGMFENAQIRQNIVKPYYDSIGVDRLGQYPLPNPNNIKIPPGWQERVDQVMIDEGYEEGPWKELGPRSAVSR